MEIGRHRGLMVRDAARRARLLTMSGSHRKTDLIPRRRTAPSRGMGERVRLRLSVLLLREPKPGLDLGDLGAADRNPVRRRSIELDDGAIAFLADKGDMRDGDDVAAM